MKTTKKRTAPDIMPSTSVEIALDEHMNPTMVLEMERAFKDHYRERLLRIIQAIILTKRHHYFDGLYPDMTIDLAVTKSSVRMILKGVPREKLVGGRLIKLKEEQILCGIRDLLLSRQFPLNDMSSESITQYIFHFVQNAHVITREDIASNPYGRIMMQGGHHIPEIESNHHKRLGFGVGLLGLELITGSGPGAMEDPMKGALRGYQMNRHTRKFIGITEDGIISGEPCNDYIDHLIVFPDIEKRLEAFIRMSRAGIIVPGGPGTFEEILTVLWIKMHPRNKKFRFPLYLCQPVQSRSYFRGIVSFLEDTFDIDFEKTGLFRMFESDAENTDDRTLDPRRIAPMLLDDMRETKEYYERLSKRTGEHFFPLWDWNVHFPERLQKPLHITKDFVESLCFDRKMAPDELFFSLRSLSSAIVEVNVRDREFLRKYGTFKLKGDPSILHRVDRLFQEFHRDGRMGMRKYLCPYRIARPVKTGKKK
ncbi:MAG: pyrimidine/purine nucleotide monophosphate nucleosidase domain-containing protein [Spirochaetota bacterium]